MDAALAYLISIGIVGFGGWSVAISKVESGVFPIWFVLDPFGQSRRAFWTRGPASAITLARQGPGFC
jgi:hypothetical protein